MSAPIVDIYPQMCLLCVRSSTCPPENDQDVLGRRAFEAIIGYIVTFFGCKTCVDHFGRELTSMVTIFPYPESYKLSVYTPCFVFFWWGGGC